MPVAAPGGALALADDLVLSRMGYGAMQLAGPGVFGPPKDLHEAIAVLRTAVDLGVTHIDTSGFYGPATTWPTGRTTSWSTGASGRASRSRRSSRSADPPRCHWASWTGSPRA
jgi:aryl-alcohol dehydrogenase-like predicted oxidoreductase